MNNLRLTIDTELTESILIESLLNYKYQELMNNKYITLLLGIYSMYHHWNITKTVYYLKLLEVFE